MVEEASNDDNSIALLSQAKMNELDITRGDTFLLKASDVKTLFA